MATDPVSGRHVDIFAFLECLEPAEPRIFVEVEWPWPLWFSSQTVHSLLVGR